MVQTTQSGLVLDALDRLVETIAQVDRMVLVRLAEQGRAQESAPAFHGRSLEPAYLAAVAGGHWSPDDEALLAAYEERLESAALPRVRRLDRRALRSVLRGAVLAVMTEQLDVPGWSQRRSALAGPYESTVGPLPAPRPAVD